VSGGSNSTADDNGKHPRSVPGTRIPLIAAGTPGRLRLDYEVKQVLGSWRQPHRILGGFPCMENENNANQAPMATSFIGSGKIGGYGVVNLQSTLARRESSRDVVREDRQTCSTGTMRRPDSSPPMRSTTTAPSGTIRMNWRNENLVLTSAKPVAVFVGREGHTSIGPRSGGA